MALRETCKACDDRLSKEATWRKDAKTVGDVSPDDYCRTCFYELAFDQIPNVIDSTVVHGSGGLTPRQAAKKH